MSESSSLLSVDSPLEQVIEPPAKPTRTPTPPPPSLPSAGYLPQIQLVSYLPDAKVFAPLQQTGSLTINYEYDPLYRLKEANYSNNDYYHYTLRQAQGGAYDAVGNRLTQQIGLVTANYVYDDANRLTSVNGVTYTFDANGNTSTSSVQACSMMASTPIPEFTLSLSKGRGVYHYGARHHSFYKDFTTLPHPHNAPILQSSS